MKSSKRVKSNRVTSDLVAAAAATGRLNTFGKAIGAAGMSDMLREPGPFTMFAPTDAAFAKVPKAELRSLLDDPRRLTRLVAHHVVRQRVKAPRAGSPTMATSVHGDALKITAEDDGFMVNGARVVKTDLRASNGVIHAIDTVLVPR
ncbi:MAG TPA: fasciclin domain-containing protein [Gemmatimonadaceae bacterium]|nr:fasciclin domain-containing protein [Gemmatimonadaceae bacterium]